MSIRLEHPTAMVMPDSPAPIFLGTPILHAVTGHPIAYDLTAHYAAKHTSVPLSSTLHLDLCYENDQLADAPGTPARIIYHWSAGNYNQCWNGYQYGIAFDPKTGEAYALRFLTNKQKGKHLWARNTGSIGISFLAMAAGEPVTHAQLMLGARLGAEFCAMHGIDPRKVEPMAHMACDQPDCNNITATGGAAIEMKVVNDHATYASADGYHRFRIDIGNADMEIVTAELLRIYDGLKKEDGSEHFQMENILK